MIIQTEKLKKQVDKFTTDPTATAIGINGDGTLVLTASNKLTFNDFVVYANDQMYLGKGSDRYASSDIPEAGLSVGVKTRTKLLLFVPDGTAELVTHKKKADPGTKFLMMAVHPGGFELAFVNGVVSHDFYYKIYPFSEENLKYVLTIVGTLLQIFNSEDRQKFSEFWGGPVYGEEEKED